MGNTPIWPAYVPDARERSLWYQDDNGAWVSPARSEARAVDSAQQMADLLFESDGMAFCGSLEMLPWFGEVVDAMGRTIPKGDKGDVFSTSISVHPQTHAPIMVTFERVWRTRGAKPRMQRQKRKLVSSSCWAMPCGPELVDRLAWLSETLGCGILPTPASVGYWMIQQEWKGKQGIWPRHHRPPLTVVQDMTAHAVGARKEAYNPDGIYDRAYGADMTNGYAAQVDVLPCGTVGGYGGEGMAQHYILPLLNDPALREASPVRHWWGHCYVRLWRDLPPGDIAPFAVRGDDGELSWPTRAGTYWCYLWNFEAEEIQRRFREDGSMEVIGVEYAHTWITETTQLAGWAEKMDGLRRAVEFGSLGEAIADPDERKDRAGMVKQTIVAGIGRLGMPYEALTVLPDDQAQEGDIPMQSDKLPYMGLVIRAVFEDRATPVHWQKFVLAKMNYAMYLKAREIWQQGITPIGINVDEVVADQPIPGTVARAVAGMGQYKGNEYTLFYAMPGPGTVITPDKLRTPGLPTRQRAAIMHGQYRRIGEGRRKTTRGELLSEQGKRAFLDEAHRRARETIERREQEIADAQAIEQCYTLRDWYVQRKYWDRIAGRE